MPLADSTTHGNHLTLPETFNPFYYMDHLEVYNVIQLTSPIDAFYKLLAQVQGLHDLVYYFIGKQPMNESQPALLSSVALYGELSRESRLRVPGRTAATHAEQGWNRNWFKT